MTAAILAALRARGVSITPTADRTGLLLAPRGVLTALEKEQLRACKRELIAALVAEIAAAPATTQDAINAFPDFRLVSGWRLGLRCGRCGGMDWVPAGPGWFECRRCTVECPPMVEAKPA